MNTVFLKAERCIGCHQCEIACLIEHSQSKNLYGALSESPIPRRFIVSTPGIRLNSSFPSKCRHCYPAPCQSVCPTSAIRRDIDMDIVLIEGNKCILCGMCAMLCPFDVISYFPSAKVKPERPVAIKCDNCIDRQNQGVIPACVEVCKVGALQFGDLNEMVSKVRAQASQSMSMIVGQASSKEQNLPAHLQSWRDWGESVREINER